MTSPVHDLPKRALLNVGRMPQLGKRASQKESRNLVAKRDVSAGRSFRSLPARELNDHCDDCYL